MVRITLRFPLGVYHAQSGASPDQPEWPPSPLRLIGALLAAAHGRQGSDPEPDRALIQRLCEAAPPLVLAPDSFAVGEPPPASDAVARLRGATRWAPRNYVDAKRGISPRNLGRDRAEVSKAGVAIGDQAVAILWPDLELTDEEADRLAALAADITFLGTTRSPVLAYVTTAPPPAGADSAPRPAWEPAGPDPAPDGIAVRIPDAATIAAFDQREAARRSERPRVQPTGLIPQIPIGQTIRYRRAGARPAGPAFDPKWWGEAIVLVVDSARSDLVPKAPAAYLVARAVRAALLSAYEEEGSEGEAPPILTARGGDPHCAFVPLPVVWGPHPSGRILGVAIILPHARRVSDVAGQRSRVEAGLRALLPGPDGAPPAREVPIPGAGVVALAPATALDARKTTLRLDSYAAPSRDWVTITPVVHSRWRKGGLDGLMRQVAADCAHVGLPEPAEVAVLRVPDRRGGAGILPPLRAVPERWRGPLQGPADHLAIRFSEPVAGPLLLGKARHFGLGLCVPDDGSTLDRLRRSAAR